MRYSKNENEPGRRTAFNSFTNKFMDNDLGKTRNRVKQFLDGGKFNSTSNAAFKKESKPESSSDS